MALKLPLLPAYEPPWWQFQAWWQEVVTAIEAQEARQDQVDTDLTAAVADIAAALAAATAAQSTADVVKRDDSIADSWTVPGSTLSASDAGSNATITIANQTRKYNDGASVSITGTNLTGKAYSTEYYIYYDDPTRADTTPAFIATTSATTAVPNAATGRHLVGKITTPAAAGASTSGGYNPPSGGGGIRFEDIV